jgi:rhodanese-related sulfurtransferase
MKMEVEKLSASDAAMMLQNDDYVLVDVRTPEEWELISAPPSNMNETVFLSIVNLPSGLENPYFLNDFMKLELSKDKKLLFVCKSGGRSDYAANLCAKLGYRCYNIIDGIERLALSLMAK